MKALLVPITLCLVANPAYADQCAWIDEAAALKAQAILKSSPQFIEYCEPCEDKAPGAPQQVKAVAVHDASSPYKEVSINGKDVDLAYVFVKTSDMRYENLASLAGCPATGVSPSLTIEAGTRTGVIITADSDIPPAPPPPPGMTAVTEVPAFTTPPVAPPQPQVYVYETTRHEIAWLPIALAAAGGVLTGAAMMLLLFAVRRRNALRPRAVDLKTRAE